MFKNGVFILISIALFIIGIVVYNKSKLDYSTFHNTSQELNNLSHLEIEFNEALLLSINPEISTHLKPELYRYSTDHIFNEISNTIFKNDSYYSTQAYLKFRDLDSLHQLKSSLIQDFLIYSKHLKNRENQFYDCYSEINKMNPNKSTEIEQLFNLVEANKFDSSVTFQRANMLVNHIKKDNRLHQKIDINDINKYSDHALNIVMQKSELEQQLLEILKLPTSQLSAEITNLFYFSFQEDIKKSNYLKIGLYITSSLFLLLICGFTYDVISKQFDLERANQNLNKRISETNTELKNNKNLTTNYLNSLQYSAAIITSKRDIVFANKNLKTKFPFLVTENIFTLDIYKYIITNNLESISSIDPIDECIKTQSPQEEILKIDKEGEVVFYKFRIDCIKTESNNTNYYLIEVKESKKRTKTQTHENQIIEEQILPRIKSIQETLEKTNPSRAELFISNLMCKNIIYQFTKPSNTTKSPKYNINKLLDSTLDQVIDLVQIKSIRIEKDPLISPDLIFNKETIQRFFEVLFISGLDTDSFPHMKISTQLHDKTNHSETIRIKLTLTKDINNIDRINTLPIERHELPNNFHTINKLDYITLSALCEAHSTTLQNTYHTDQYLALYADFDFHYQKVYELNSQKILIAEDDEIQRLIISKLLTTKNVEITFAENGNEAVRLHKSNTYDLILMDVNMPVMNGIEAIKKIRKVDINTPIIVLTSEIRESIHIEAMQVGATDIALKPLSNSKLQQFLILNKKEEKNANC